MSVAVAEIDDRLRLCIRRILGWNCVGDRLVRLDDAILDRVPLPTVARRSIGLEFHLATGNPSSADRERPIGKTSWGQGRLRNRAILDRLMRKTAILLNRFDPTFDAGMADRTRLEWRGDFFADGYAVFDDNTANAVSFASEELGLSLETTYTGKAMAALLHDIQQPEYQGETYLFWNTHSSSKLPVSGDEPDTLRNIPEDFRRYYT